AKEWTGSLRAETTIQQHSRSGDSHQGNFYLSGPIKDDLLGLSLYGNYAHRDEDDIFDGYNKARNMGGTAKLALTPNKDHDFVLEAESYQQQFESRLGKTRDPAFDDENSRRDLDRQRYALSHTGRWSPDMLTDSYIQRERTRNKSRDMTIE